MPSVVASRSSIVAFPGPLEGPAAGELLRARPAEELAATAFFTKNLES